ncbi:MAG: phage head morphogenesis protein, partial [Chloroflexi bacterium]|nr:phage head morphogenesis protein [Chloroflexota bacterium]
SGRAYEEAGYFQWRKTWQTNNDDDVCEYCAPMHNQPASAVGIDANFITGLGPTNAPPLHPKCRCWFTQEPVFEES